MITRKLVKIHAIFKERTYKLMRIFSWKAARTAACSLALLAACSHSNQETITLGVLAFNDFHGNLEPPAITIPVETQDGMQSVPAGGVVYLASAIDDFRTRYPHNLIVSAGDLISASPLISSLFLDEPTIYAMNAIAIDFNAVGNHEFDRGQRELLRLQQGGCEQWTLREPCQVRSHFPGAHFGFLGANVITKHDTSLLPSYGIKRFNKNGQQVTLGVIGITTKDTANSVNQTGIAGLKFEDEALAANRTANQLKAKGADIIMLVIHEGGKTETLPLEQGCDGLSGQIVPILEKLDPSIAVVVSGHTHRAYVCQHTNSLGHQRLLTSAGEKGTLVTEIALTWDMTRKQLRDIQAHNRVVQGEGFSKGSVDYPLVEHLPVLKANAQVAAIVDEYRVAAKEQSQRVVGYSNHAFSRQFNDSGESHLGQLIADAQLYAANSDASTRADLSFMNTGGLRADLSPNTANALTFADIFGVLPFGNRLVTLSLSGESLYRLLEEQFNSGTNTLASPRILQVSRGVSYTLDLSAPAGNRVVSFELNGEPILPDQIYRIATHDYLANGGDNFTTFTSGFDRTYGMLDVDAFELYLIQHSPLENAFDTRITLVRPTHPN